MWTNYFAWILAGERKLVWLALIVMGVLLLAWWIAYFCDSRDILMASIFLVLGASCLLASLDRYSVQGIGNFFFLFMVVAGGLYLLLCFALSIKKKVRARKKKRKELRKITYTLPEKDNGYVRDRLHTALQINEKECEDDPKTQIRLRLGYAKSLLEKLKSGTLTFVERAEVGELSRILSLYTEKEEWSRKEVQTVNDLFMRLLKLSAKYEIAN